MSDKWTRGRSLERIKNDRTLPGGTVLTDGTTTMQLYRNVYMDPEGGIHSQPGQHRTLWYEGWEAEVRGRKVRLFRNTRTELISVRMKPGRVTNVIEVTP